MMSASQLGAELRKPAEDHQVRMGGTGGDKDQQFGRTLLDMAKEADRIARNYFNQNNKSEWERAYKSYRSEHFAGSKYTSNEWKGRSRLFRPKTKTAGRKDQQALASALFSTPNVVTIGPGNEADPRQEASAAIKQQLINYRLTRQNEQAAIPWFTISMGAAQTSFNAGVIVSKQYWCREVEMVDQQQPVMGGIERDPMTGEDLPQQPVLDEMGQPMMETTQVERTILDRPDITLFPPENVHIDPTAPWTSPVQGGAYILLDTPMTVDGVVEMMSKNRNTYSEVEWLDVSRDEIERHANFAGDTEGVRRAREGGNDRYRDSTGSTTNASTSWGVVWVKDCYIRYQGKDWTFYSIGTDLIISKPKLVKDTYPAFNGQRPIIYGYGQIEAFRITPQSKNVAMQPLQQEANDIANLRLDQLKNVVMPLAKVARGADVDTEMLKRRGPNVTVLMKNPETDLIWDRPPDIPASAYQEQNLVNADMDDLNGSFTGSSVATNRQMNETVGGMNLMSGAANAATEFDLRVIIETWVEPVLAQVIKLEEYYEVDPVILGLCGARAQLLEKHGISEIDDDLLNRQVTTTVDAGLGSSDPMQKLQKLQIAFQTAGPIIAPGVQSGEVKIKYKEVVTACFGAAGFSDAGERFIEVKEPQEMPPPPEVQQAQMEAEEKEKDRQSSIAEKKMELKSKEAMHAAELAQEMAIEEIKVRNTVTSQLLKLGGDQQMAAAGHDRALEMDDRKASQADRSALLSHASGMDQLSAKGDQAMSLGEQKGDQALALGGQKGEQAMALGDQRGQQQLSMASSRPGKGGKPGKSGPGAGMVPPGKAIAELAAFASATLPIMNSMYAAMQAMQQQMDGANGPLDISRGPEGINKVSRGGKTMIPRRNPVTGDIDGFDPEGLPPGPGGPPPGGPPAPPEGQMPPGPGGPPPGAVPPPGSPPPVGG
jgi:hypothetical protein